MFCVLRVFGKNKIEGLFCFLFFYLCGGEICLTLPTEHQLGLFPQLTAFIVCVGLKWSYIKGLFLCGVDALVVGAAQQEDSYLLQLLAAASRPK